MTGAASTGRLDLQHTGTPAAPFLNRVVPNPSVAARSPARRAADDDHPTSRRPETGQPRSVDVREALGDESRRRHDRPAGRLATMEPVLVARGLVKSYKAIRAVDGIDLDVGAGRAGRPARSERRRQDHHAAHAARRRSPPTRAPSSSPATASRGSGRRAMDRGRLRRRLPAPARSSPGPRGARHLRRLLRRADDGPRRSPRPRAVPHRRTSPTACARSCRRDSARSSASSRRSCTIPGCSCSTSRPRRSIPTSRLRVRTGLLEVCRDEGTALLVTSHDMLEVERLCERVVFIAGGHIVADGTPADVAAVRPRRPRGRVPRAGRHRPDGQPLDPVDVAHLAPHGQTPEPMTEEHR